MSILGRAALTPDESVTGGKLRRIVLDGTIVDYRMLRARRRTIGMQVDLDGLTVRAPRWVSLGEIEAALAERSTWILRTLAEWRTRRRDVFPREWKTGAPIYFRGAELSLAVFPARRSAIRHDLFDLTVLHPAAHDERKVATFVSHWLRDEALRLLAPRVAEFAREVTTAAPPIKLSNAKSEWGSCNQRGEIRLNWRLVQLPDELADYVVAHEVAHLVELNHSPRFWAVVERLMPGHGHRRRALEEWSALLAA
ncbi:MAG TPA: SprT family zinc-dependent metalloprotease [Casimicrobiaceae bacterium]